MDKSLIIAKIRRWQAELGEMIATLQDEGKKGPIVDALKKRKKEIDLLIEAISDKSLIPKGEVAFEPGHAAAEIEGKVKKVKAGIKKIKKLSKEKKKILKDLDKE